MGSSGSGVPVEELMEQSGNLVLNGKQKSRKPGRESCTGENSPEQNLSEV